MSQTPLVQAIVMALLCACLVAGVRNACSAQEIPQIHSLKKIGYRTERQCWSVTEDCDGYLYVATASGVLIYNGFQWQSVNLPLNRIPRAVFRGNDCRIYTSGFESFGYIAVEEGKDPYYVPVGDALLDGTNEEMWSIYGNAEEMIVQSFAVVYIYNYDTLRLIPTQTSIMPGREIDGSFYIPWIRGGVYEITEGAPVLRYTIDEKDDLIKIAGICKGADPGTLILATEKSGVFVASEAGVRRLQSPDLDEISAHQINGILRLNSGTYVIGTILNGIYITDDLLHIRYHINKNNGLSDNTVLSLYEDSHGDVWVGLDSGLDLVGMSSPVRFYYDATGILGTVYSSVWFQGDFLLATNHGIFLRNPDESFSLLPNTQGQAWSFLHYDDLLLCGHNNGTYAYAHGRIRQISDITGGWWMEQLDSNTILQATYTGLIKLQWSDSRWSTTRLTKGNIPMRKFVRAGTRLLGFHPRYGLSISRLSEDYNHVLEEHAFSHIAGELIAQHIGMFASGNRIFVHQDVGLFEVLDTALVRLTEDEVAELEVDMPFHQAYEAYRTLIASGEDFTAANLDHMALSSMQHCIYSRDEGYEISSIKSPPDSLPVHIDYVMLDGVRQEHGILKELKAGQSNLSIQLKNLVEKPNQRSLWYRLESGDQTWQPVPPNGELVFRNLSNGEYTLKIKDVYQNQATLASFSIPPFWYLSWQGAVLYIAIVCGAFWLWNGRVKRKMAEDARRKLREKEKQLEAERIKSNNERLEREILLKSRVLANRAMALIQKNKLLNQMKDLVQSNQFAGKTNDQLRSRIIHMVDQHTDHEDEWAVFQENFDEVHEKFTERLMHAHPDLTSGEKRLAAFIRMDLSSKEIAPLLSISVRSVENKRHRLRKKLNLAFGDSLSDYLMRL